MRIPSCREGLTAKSSQVLHKDQQGGGSNELTAEATGKSAASARETGGPNRQNHGSPLDRKQRRGRKRVSSNAVKHGFFSKWLLVQHQDGKESQREYDDLYAAVGKHYQPVGWLEELWVERIAVSSWRLRREIRCESGQISLALAGRRIRPPAIKSGRTGRPGIRPFERPGNRRYDRSSFLAKRKKSLTRCCDMKR